MEEKPPERWLLATEVLDRSGILEILREYRVFVAGTIPLGIDVEGSDLDLLCQSNDLGLFLRVVQDHFGHHRDFQAKLGEVGGFATATATFGLEGFFVEIFAQNRPVELQEGYLHFQVERRLLRLAGESGKLALRDWRKRGYKTEPAFAAWLGLTGDPYQALLDLAVCDDDFLLGLVPSS